MQEKNQTESLYISIVNLSVVTNLLQVVIFFENLEQKLHMIL